MKKNKNNILMALVVLVVGGLIGSQIERKLFLKKNEEADQTLKPKSKMEVNFLLPANRSGPDYKLESLNMLEEKLSSDEYTFSFYINRGGPTKGPVIGDVVTQLGMIDPIRIIELQRNGSDITAEFITSPRDDQECFSEVQFITTVKNNINSLQELDKKNLGAVLPALLLINLPLKELKEQNIKANQLIVFKDLNEGLAELKLGKIDAIATRVSVFTNTDILSKIGGIQNGSFVNNPDLKIITTTENKIPCSAVFISNSLPESIKTTFMIKFLSLSTTPEGRKLLSEGIGISSINKINPDMWEDIKSKIKDVNTYQLKSFASEVITK